MSLKFIEATQSGDFICNPTIFNKLFDEETKKLPLCVLCITGIFRGGKSFFLNLVMRYLRYLARGGKRESEFSSIPEWVKGEGKYLDGYIKPEKKNTSQNGMNELPCPTPIQKNGVGVKGGEKPVTTGIDFVKELFVIPDPQNPTRKICILLMDTQGLWDPNTDSKCNGSIFGLSCTLSSYLIFNHMGVLSSENLSQLATLTDFSSGLAKIQCQGKKAFQQLTILFRDCKDIDKRYDREIANEVMAEKWEELTTSPAYKKHTDKLQECFEGFDAMYICKPGDIDTPKYDGNLDEVNDLFFVLMGHFIEDIFMKIRPRIIGGEEVTGKTFIDYSINFAELFQNENTYPDSSMIMDAACDVKNCKIIDNYCVEFESILKEYTKGEDPVDDQELKAKSDIEIKKMIAEFQTKVNGSDKLKEKNTKDLDYKLNRSYKDAKIKNDTKILRDQQFRQSVLFQAVNTYCTSFSDYINDDFCIPSVIFDEAHKKSLQDAVDFYSSKRFLTQKARVQLVKEINIKKNENIKKRTQFIKIYGQSIKITKDSEYSYLEATVTSVIIGKKACPKRSSFDISECQELKQLTIRDGNFKNVSSFSIKNLPNLVSVTIGNDCFLSKDNSVKCSFIISNCMNLEVIAIGCQSFKDYSSFKLSQLQKLKKLILGNVSKKSENFVNCKNFTLSDFPKLVEVQIGHSSFKYTSDITFSNLRDLKEIQLGEESFYCSNSGSHSFVLRDLPSLNRLQSNGESLKNITNVKCSNVPNCDSICLLHAFSKTSCSNYKCNNCSKELEVMGAAFPMLADVLAFVTEIVNSRLSDEDAVKLVDECIQTLNKYEDLDIYHNRRTIIIDCKGVLNNLENALEMEIRTQNERRENNRINKGNAAAKKAGWVGLGIVTTVGAAALALAFPVASPVIFGLAGNAVDSIVNEYDHESFGCYDDEYYVCRIEKVKEFQNKVEDIRKRYSKYF